MRRYHPLVAILLVNRAHRRPQLTISAKAFKSVRAPDLSSFGGVTLEPEELVRAESRAIALPE